VNERIEGYFNGVGKDWTRLIVEYAVARDAACWQLNKTEPALLEQLQIFEEVAGSMGNGW
jgi:hypothetical protein